MIKRQINRIYALMIGDEKVVSKRAIVLAIAALLLVVFCLQLVLNYYTPICADDYNYSFQFGTGERLTSITQIPSSMWNHIHSTNGRTLNHTLLQLSLLTTPFVFDLINSLLFVLLIVLVVFHAKGELIRTAPLHYALAFLFVLIFTGAYGECFLWQTGSANYMWSLIIVLLSLVPITIVTRKDHTVKRTNLFKVTGAFIIGLIAGATNENTAIAVIAVIFLSLVYERITAGKTPVWLLLQMIGVVVGLASILLSPGQLVRLEREGGSIGLGTIIRQTQKIAAYVCEAYWPLLIIAAVGLIISFRQQSEGKKIITMFPALIWLGGFAAGVACLVVVAAPTRTYTAPLIFLIISLGKLIGAVQAKDHIIVRRCAAASLAVLTVTAALLYFEGVSQVRQEKIAVADREAVIQQYKNEGKSEIVLSTIKGWNKFCAYSEFGDLNDDSERWPNWAIADYYGFDRVIKDGSEESFQFQLR